MFNAMVLAHYDFKNSKGQEIKTTKIRVNLGDYGLIEVCTDLANKYDCFSEILVDLDYDMNKNKVVVKKVN